MQVEGIIVSGNFLKRVNRFIASVNINGKEEMVHITNTGRMGELLQEDAHVLLRKEEGQHRKTAYDLLMVYHQDKLISLDSKLANQLFYYSWKNNLLEEFADYSVCFPEVSYGRSRLDFLLKEGQERLLIEIKSVTLVENNRALFPDAPTNRGKKHLEELMRAKEEGLRTMIIFIVQREDGIYFSPYDTMDKAFSNTLREAREKGVEVYAYNCQVTIRNIILNKKIPVIL